MSGEAFVLALSGLRDREKLAASGLLRGRPGECGLLLGVVGTDRVERLFAKLFDETEFLSPLGLRAISAHHREHPYEPAESTSAMFGGNSDWRGRCGSRSTTW